MFIVIVHNNKISSAQNVNVSSVYPHIFCFSSFKFGQYPTIINLRNTVTKRLLSNRSHEINNLIFLCSVNTILNVYFYFSVISFKNALQAMDM